MRRRFLLALPALLLGACQDDPPTAPAAAGPVALASIAIVPGFHFLPPMVADPGPFSGTFDAGRAPTARVVCTGATGSACPQVAAFGGAGEPAISVDLEGESYGVVWQTPATLALGRDLYRLEVHDGTSLLGSADLWVVGSRQELKSPGADVGVVRGTPLVIKFRIETSGGDQPAVALVEVTPAASSVLAGGTVQLSAVTKDGGGNVLADRPVGWTSSDDAVATVSSTGLVTTHAPGEVTITATSEAQSGTATVESVDPAYIPVFQRPFDVAFEVRTLNYHDHDEPREFVDANGVYLPWWGESSLVGIDGHEGYDWELPVGTPILAVAAGTVELAGVSAPFSCPVLPGGIADDQVLVRIDHDLPGGVRVRTIYVHLSRRDVSVGQQVTEGQQIGLSGNTGCSTRPHLHFAVQRLTQTNDGTPSPIDPYGWAGAAVDPWTTDPEGAASIWLWQPGEERTLFRSVLTPFAETPGVFVQITRVRFQGVRDDQNPNNEYIEVTRDGRTAAPDPLDISGFTLTTRAGLVYTFPTGTLLTSAQPTARVLVGAGTNGPGVLHWGRAAGVLDNLLDCVRFRNVAGALRNQAGWGGGCLSP